MRVVLFPIFLFLSPAIFKVCNATCSLSLQWMAGIKLLSMKEVGELSFFAMVLWFLVAYFLACLVSVNYEYFAER